MIGILGSAISGIDVCADVSFSFNPSNRMSQFAGAFSLWTAGVVTDCSKSESAGVILLEL